MTNRILNSVTAAVLLLGGAAALLPAPAAAQYRAQYAAAIEAFDVRGDRRIEAGRDLRFLLRGTPRAQAWVDIPGVVNGIALRETRPGEYEGDYTVRVRDNPDAFRQAVATLQTGSQRVSARVAFDDDRRGRRDNEAPQISDLTPAHGARVDDDGRVRIAARLTDQGRRGIDPQSITLRVNGRDVTRDARVRGDEIEYRANLPRGRYTAELAVSDRAGNVARRSWSFDVVDRHARATPAVPVPVVPLPLPVPGVVVPAAAPLEITSHTPDSEWNINNPTPIRGRTFPLATVRLTVQSVLEGGSQHTAADSTVRADAAGNFAILPRLIPSPMPATGDYYHLQLSASGAGQAAQTQMRLRHGPR